MRLLKQGCIEKCKEKAPGAEVSKEDHADRLLGHERTNHK